MKESCCARPTKAKRQRRAHPGRQFVDLESDSTPMCSDVHVTSLAGLSGPSHQRRERLRGRRKEKSYKTGVHRRRCSNLISSLPPRERATGTMHTSADVGWKQVTVHSLARSAQSETYTVLRQPPESTDTSTNANSGTLRPSFGAEKSFLRFQIPWACVPARTGQSQLSEGGRMSRNKLGSGWELIALSACARQPIAVFARPSQ